MNAALDRAATAAHLRELVAELNALEARLATAIGHAHDDGFVVDLLGPFTRRQVNVIPPSPKEQSNG